MSDVNLAETGEVALLMPNEPHVVRDTALHHRDGHLERINVTHRSCDPLHYVLLHPHGPDGWSPEMKRQQCTSQRPNTTPSTFGTGLATSASFPGAMRSFSS